LAECVYEGMFLLDSNRYGRDPDGVAGQIPAMIQEAGGQMLVSRLWEERRLAYPIKGHRKGTYWLTYFRLDGGQLADLKRQCRLSNSILRVLFLKIDPRIVDALVEHARAGQAKAGGELGGDKSAQKEGKPRQPGAPPSGEKQAQPAASQDKKE
jgi:small subunit ribosomal protein S6